MEAWDVVVVGATIAGMRAAIAAYDEGASVVILSAHGLGNSGSDTYSSGLAASIDESNPMSHRDDTIRGGDWLNDQDIVSKRTSLINSHISQLDQWGLNFRRSLSGSPNSEKGLGHKAPRVLTTGFSTSREIQHILEEQCIRRSIMRRGDWFPLSLSNSNGQVTGIVALDMMIDFANETTIEMACARWCQGGHHLGTTWAPPGHHGHHLGTTWASPGHHVGTSGAPLGQHLGTTWA